MDQYGHVWSGRKVRVTFDRFPSHARAIGDIIVKSAQFKFALTSEAKTNAISLANSRKRWTKLGGQAAKLRKLQREPKRYLCLQVLRDQKLNYNYANQPLCYSPHQLNGLFVRDTKFGILDAEPSKGESKTKENGWKTVIFIRLVWIMFGSFSLKHGGFFYQVIHFCKRLIRVTFRLRVRVPVMAWVAD